MGNDPVAWVAFATDGSESAVTALNRQAAEEMAAKLGWAVAPLYRSPTLTDAEREAIVTALAFLREEADEPGVAQDAATLRGLLERTR